MATVIKPTAVSNFKSRATANSKWMIVLGANYSIAAFEDNTRIFRNGVLDTSLNRQEVSTRFYSTGDVISTDVGKGFSFTGTAGGKTGICYAWEGTLFAHRVDRFTPTFYYTATRGPATVTITRKAPSAGTDTVVVNADVVQKDELKTYQASDTDDQYIVTSDTPIAVYIDDIEGTTQGSDSLPLYPASTEFFGTFSNGGHIINCASGTTNILIRASDGTKRQIALNNLGGTNQDNSTGPVSSGGSFQNASCKVISDQPIFCESQADGDGGEMTPFVSREAFGTEFVIPEDENEWVKLVSDVPATYEVYDSANVYLGGGSLAGSFFDSARTVGATFPGERVGGIYQVRIGTATEGASNLTRQKNLIRTSAPVYGVFESEDDDETVLFARAKMNNSSVHVNPKVITDGLVLSVDYANVKCIDQDVSATTCKNLVNIDGPGGIAVGGGAAGKFMTWRNDPDVGPVINGDGSDDGIHFDEQLGTGNSEVTYQFWVYKTSSAENYFFDARGGDYSGGGGGVYCFSNYLSTNINVDNTLKYNFSSSYNASDPKFLNRWLCIAITGKTSENGLIYINGEEITNNSQGLNTSYSNQNPIDTDIGEDFRIGHRYNMSFTSPFLGYMGPWLIYTRKLSDDEIMQNFLAYRGRFGV